MQEINSITYEKQEIKKSTFIAYLCPFDEFETLKEKLKQKHPKAVHIVWAYRVLNKHMQIVENQSDDGEPKGTSGQPSLNALRGADLINSATLIVRYFGGIKLGTGGLVRAYSSSVNLALQSADLKEFQIKDECKFFIDFSIISRFEHYFEKESLKPKKDFNQLGAEFSINVNKEEFLNFYNFCLEFSPNSFKFLALPIFCKEIFKDK